ncbi:cyclic pyranopterin phosphate synthase [Bacillus haynesii]|uniref:GTP 3',8-cyclase n=1 Tax=Bacillus haynesii TaxID=1925021 RepID=A0ABX3I1L1_9BACI|nr:GTP 3',8-cyclase MoaA [Bacillus haynesii]OMI25017.1 cyclic pyranopterin phosphate synthase [Bacillus haynesii]
MKSNQINDKYERPLQDLRISIMDKCNFRCSYCMPAEAFGEDYSFMPQNELLTYDEIERLVIQFTELGVRKIRLTGGEPLLRKDIHLLIERLSKINNIDDIAMTTNGLLLVKQAHALKEAGLMRVNISLDALNEHTIQSMNGRNIKSERILSGIDAALDARLFVKVNMVVIKGVNENEVLKMAAYCKNRRITLRFIEFMDVGQTNDWDFSKVVTKKELLDIVSSVWPLEELQKDKLGEVASRYKYKGTNIEIGFISSVSEPFCNNCTRARISADGKLYTCLFAESGYDLRGMIRSGATDEEIKNKISEVWKKRTDKYSELRTAETAKHRKKIEMSYIGG